MRLVAFYLFFLISFATSAKAVSISEIMYDPQGADTGREWVEVFNDTGDVIDFTSWKFFENNTNHSIVTYQGGSNVQSNGYAVIADNSQKFLVDYPNYKGVLYDSAFSLLNTGEELFLKNNSTAIVDTINYSSYVNLGGDDDGSTLSLSSSTWSRGKATPGEGNVLELKVETKTDSDSTNNGQATVAQMSPPSANIVLYMMSEKIAVAGSDTEFKVSGLKRSGENINDLSCAWAYGDGGQGVGTTTIYSYAYTGSYLAKVQCGNGYVTGDGFIKVSVVSPDIFIVGFGAGKRGSYIDIENPNNYDIDFSQWRLNIGYNIYSFPKNTVLIKKSTTRISGRALGFASLTIDKNTNISITFPNGEEVTKFALKDEKILGVSNILPVSTLEEKIDNVKILPTKKISTQKMKAETVISTSTQADLNTRDTRLITWFKSLFGK